MSTRLVDLSERRLFDGPTDEFMALNKIKYQFLWDAYLASSANHWQPMEIPLSLDVEQWRYPERYGITEHDKTMVKYALGFFAVADSLVADNLLLGFYRRASAPELRMWLSRQQYEEAVHTHAYQYIIESLEIDTTEIFAMHLQVAAIYDKMRFASNQSDDVATQLLSYYGIMEGIFFYAMFAILMKMSSQNKFPGVAKQFEYIMRDEAQHFRTGIQIYKQYRAETPLTSPIGVMALFDEAVAMEFNFINEAVKDVRFQAELREYVRWVRKQRLQALGYTPIAEIINPFPFMEELIEAPKLTNFFESTVTDYQLGGSLKWS